MPKRHSRALPAEVQDQIRLKTRELKELFAPYALPLTADEKRELPLMGDKTLAFVEKAHAYAAENPALRPPYLDLDDFSADLNDAVNIRAESGNLTQLLDTLNNLQTVAGSEAYQAALAFYNYLKLLVKQGVPTAKPLYADLKSRFPGRGNRPDPLDDSAT
jgi:hypothetical protein